MTLLDDATGMSDELTRLRRELHREPEIGLQLPRTQERVLTALEDLPLEIFLGTSTTSVTAVAPGRRGTLRQSSSAATWTPFRSTSARTSTSARRWTA